MLAGRLGIASRHQHHQRGHTPTQVPGVVRSAVVLVVTTHALASQESPGLESSQDSEPNERCRTQDNKHVFVELSILALYKYKSGVLMYCWGRVSFRTSQIETRSGTLDTNHTSRRSLMSLGAIFRFLFS